MTVSDTTAALIERLTNEAGWIAFRGLEFARPDTLFGLLREAAAALAAAKERAREQDNFRAEVLDWLDKPHREDRWQALVPLLGDCWEDVENIGRLYAEANDALGAAERDRDALREAIIQARRDLWWFIEQDHEERGGEWVEGEIGAAAMRIQDDVLGAALARVDEERGI